MASFVVKRIVEFIYCSEVSVNVGEVEHCEVFSITVWK